MTMSRQRATAFLLLVEKIRNENQCEDFKERLKMFSPSNRKKRVQSALRRQRKNISDWLYDVQQMP